MKIFWSWQSDTHQPSGRYFVRDLLRDVAKSLNSVEAAEEADRPDNEEQPEEAEAEEEYVLPEDDSVHVDHDTFGVGGSPRIADKILEKIRAAAVFVADITPIATTKSGKRVPNPNVMLELGYALRVMEVERIILIGNQSFGAGLSYLPFDLKHWRAPIFYKLREDSSDEHRDKLASELKKALRQSLLPALKLAEKQMREERRRTERAPELSVVLIDDSGEPLRISQTPNLSSIDSLDDRKAKTPLLPVPKQQVTKSLQGITFPHPTKKQWHGMGPKPVNMWSIEEIEGYNRRVQEYYADYSRYLDRMAEYAKRLLRSFDVELHLDNSGTAPATDIDVVVQFPTGIILMGEDDDALEPPTAPHPPEKETARSQFAHIKHSAFDVPSLVDPLRYLPKSTNVHAEVRQVTFKLADLKHHHRAPFRSFRVFLDTPEDIASFEADYVITANEPLEPIRGTLIFAIEPVS